MNSHPIRDETNSCVLIWRLDYSLDAKTPFEYSWCKRRCTGQLVLKQVHFSLPHLF